MQKIVKGRHMKLTDPLKNYAEAKLASVVGRVFNRPAVKIDIELSKLGHVANGSDNECRVVVSIPKHKPVIINQQSADMYQAINLAHGRLMQQVVRERRRARKISQQRKMAQRHRDEVAFEELSCTPEVWEHEVKEYEIATLA
jgi:ribosomal subunit interface protein